MRLKRCAAIVLTAILTLASLQPEAAVAYAAAPEAAEKIGGVAAETEDTLIYDSDLSDTAYDSETGYDDPMEDAYDVFADDSLYDEDPVGDDLSSGDADAYSSYDEPTIDEQNIVEDADSDADEILSEDDGLDAAADSDSELYVEDDEEALSETDASDEALGAGGMTLDANGGAFSNGKSTYSLSYTTTSLSYNDNYIPVREGYAFFGMVCGIRPEHIVIELLKPIQSGEQT